MSHSVYVWFCAAPSDLKRDPSRPSWWAPVREGSAVDVNSPLKKQKFQTKKPSRYTPGAGLVPAEAPVAVLAPTIVPGVSGVSQSNLPMSLPGPSSSGVRPLAHNDQQPFLDRR